MEEPFFLVRALLGSVGVVGVFAQAAVGIAKRVRENREDRAIAENRAVIVYSPTPGDSIKLK
jgi:hypothetical protein